jgi:hypothetical protein
MSQRLDVNVVGYDYVRTSIDLRMICPQLERWIWILAPPDGRWLEQGGVSLVNCLLLCIVYSLWPPVCDPFVEPMCG